MMIIMIMIMIMIIIIIIMAYLVICHHGILAIIKIGRKYLVEMSFSLLICLVDIVRVTIKS